MLLCVFSRPIVEYTTALKRLRSLDTTVISAKRFKDDFRSPQALYLKFVGPESVLGWSASHD
jgi:hypothetical protein